MHRAFAIGLSLVFAACAAGDVITEIDPPEASSGDGSGGAVTGSTTSTGDGSGGGSTSTGDGAGNPATSGEVTFLCYNVHGLPALITGDNTAGRMTAIAPLLNDFDFVALQEDFMPNNHAILVNASTHTQHVWFDVLFDQARIYGSGLSVFGDSMPVEPHHEHYGACNGVFDGANDCLSSKGFQMVQYELAPGVEVDVYNTHLDAGGGSADDDARADQVDQLLSAIAQLSPDRAVVLMGDMNLEEDDPNEAPTLQHLITSAGFTDACDALACPEPGRIERILFRSGASVSLDVQTWTNEAAFENDGQPLSDHPAVSAKFAWSSDDR